ncbi:hypothetical protein S7335_2198 [Synechococcus sp. PCC 7335]|nr:hypothetical protein S7335_2198 [Synechococcus sp. PCC 7335]
MGSVVFCLKRTFFLSQADFLDSQQPDAAARRRLTPAAVCFDGLASGPRYSNGRMHSVIADHLALCATRVLPVGNV